MPTAGDQVTTQPGSDARAPTQNLQQNVAASLSEATGVKVDPAQVAPPSTQSPLGDDLKHSSESPSPERDFGDIIAGEKGRPRTEPSRNFLKLFFQRLKKKNPGSGVMEE